MLFSELQLNEELMEGLNAMGFKEATPVQQQAIPLILENKDLLACAQTGTGKTAAFILPILHKIKSENTTGINTLVIVPTRELAMQIDQQIEGLGYFVSVSSRAVFGGGDGITWEAQKKSLTLGADIVVATPGRLIAMLSMGKIDFSSLKHLVLDEADRMLDMGFFEDIMRIIGYLPKERQTLLFSATMPPKIETLANKILNNPFKFNLSLSKPAAGISQQAYVVYNKQKDDLLLSILENKDFDSVLIFASTKIKVKQIGDMLKAKKLDVKSFHSDLEQEVRGALLRDFKNRQLRIIVATDVLARGIDVDNISLVVNYDAPGDPEDYVHRVGRTARAEKTGVAITFIGEEEQRKFSGVERLIDATVPKMPLPASIGKGPDYDPSRRPVFERKQGGGGRFHKRSKPSQENGRRDPVSGQRNHSKDEKPRKRYQPRNKRNNKGDA
ncbi:MAG: DEAD/DEAH box helicase [Bacteroidetes bacterium]|nr:MAG: DEAD/DEAH box helicase [Bacteroidota bacterium]